MVAFTSAHDGDHNVGVMNADSSDQIRIAFNGEVRDRSSVWSSDGKQIAYMSEHDGNIGWYVMNADGSNEPRQFNNPAHKMTCLDAMVLWGFARHPPLLEWPLNVSQVRSLHKA